MADCVTCAELAKRLDEVIANIHDTVEELQGAMANMDRKSVAALDVELKSALASKSAAFEAWMDHRNSHED